MFHRFTFKKLACGSEKWNGKKFTNAGLFNCPFCRQFRRMGRHQAVGQFEFLVLIAVLSLRGDGYAVSIRQAIEAQSGRSVARGALYTTLARLEEKGLLRSSLGDATPVRGGRPKRFYEVTPSGLAALRTARDELVAPWRGVARLLGGANG
jgi:PadR family transcriptional regulator PadR